MDKATQIRELLRSVAGTGKPVFGFRLMEVVEVEGDLCRARIGDLEIPDVRLASIAGGAEHGVLVVPAAGSIVVAADLSGGELREFCVVGCSEVESIRFRQGGTTLTADARGATVEAGGCRLRIDADGAVFDDGANRGLVKVEQLAEKLNRLENAVNELKKIFGTWQPTPQDGGAALKTAATQWAGTILPTTRRSELENEKVKH